MQQAPPGWYPQRDGSQRFWDGVRWTDHVAPSAHGQPRAQGSLGAAFRSAVSPTQAYDPEALWQTTGRPLTGVGGGRYKLTRQYLFFEKGILSTDAQQVPVAMIFDVDVKQSLTQKTRGVGSIWIRVQRPHGLEVVELADIPDFREGQRIINDTANAARIALQQAANTHRYESVGPPQAAAVPVGSQTAPAAPVSEAAARQTELFEQLRQLGQLHDAGVLTDTEFASKKAEILGRL